MFGAMGRMGREVMRAVDLDEELELTSAVDTQAPPGGEEIILGSSTVKILPSLDDLDPDSIDVAIDFTHADPAAKNIEWALSNGVHAVVGTTGIPTDEIGRLAEIAGRSEANALIAPNFALGAVVMMRLGEVAALIFPECEIIEMHHRGKIDAPSGTALETVRRIEAAMSSPDLRDSTEREVPGARGARCGGMRVHSVRLDGIVASQRVIFGSPGETLTISHDTTDRSCFMPGVIMAVKAIDTLPGLTLGLESVLGL